MGRGGLRAHIDPAGTVRRLAAAAIVLAAAIGFAVLTTGSSGAAGGSYEVRAIFDDAAFAVPGEDVRIAGARVGSIQELDVTPNQKAAVTLDIADSRFTPFYANARCSIRPQSLIGEKYVDCDPGTSTAPPLARIPSGPGKSTYLLPVTRTSSPVDVDIVAAISRQPTRQQFALLIDELGTGLAGRGSDLNAVIHRANPSLGYTDQVFKILARQSRGLAQLATDADAVLGPLAQERRAIADFIVQAQRTASASAARSADISLSIAKFPAFLRQLTPLMVDLGALADQGTPVFAELGKAAPALGTAFTNLAPFATAATPALIDLGAAAQRSQPYLLRTVPLAQQLESLGAQVAPAAGVLDRLTASLQQTGGINRLMDLLFYLATAANGFDGVSHYLRSELIVNSCTKYQTTPLVGCSANFIHGGASADRASQLMSGIARAAAPPAAAPAGLTGLLHYLTGSGR